MVSKQDSVPTKSQNYLYAQSVFFVQFNDIDFYVEDQDSESLYYIVFSRLFPSVKIDRVYPLGGKNAVIQHAKSGKSTHSVYVLDKDFDDLLAIQLRLPNVFYLDRLCIENYLLEASAIARFIVSEKPSLTEAKVANLFNIESFLTDCIAALRLLFFHFFLAQKYAIPLENTSLPLTRFTQKKQTWLIDFGKVNAYQQQVASAVANANGSIAAEKRRFSKAFEVRRSRPEGINVSGKYLLSLVLRRVSSVFRVHATNQASAAYRLAEYCVFASLADFQERVSKMVAQQKR